MTDATRTDATIDDTPTDETTTDDTPTDETTRVAVACQGGGSHTAFTAGVLTRILEADEPDFEVTALTGTSGGALCAFLTWYGLRTEGPDRAVELLDALWDDLAAKRLDDAMTNAAVVTATAALHLGLPIPQVSPAHVTADDVARARLTRAVERHVDHGVLDDLVDPTDPEPPRILVSAVDVTDGRFETFSDRPAETVVADDASTTDDADVTGDATGTDESSRATSRSTDSGRTAESGTGGDGRAPVADHRLEPAPRPISVDALLASAAVPTLFEAVEIPDGAGHGHAYWDGLFSQNPPVRNLLSGGRPAAEKPDEIWLVRINPERRPGRLTSLPEILDRRNELAGSLSLYQELHFVRTVNEWLEDGRFDETYERQLKSVTVRQVALDESRLDPPRRLLGATKLDRAPEFLSDLRRLGAEQADEFLDDPTAEEHVVVAAPDVA